MDYKRQLGPQKLLIIQQTDKHDKLGENKTKPTEKSIRIIKETEKKIEWVI